MSKHSVGLTIGKFAPLHKGHTDMIEFALRHVDTLYVVVYHVPDKTDISLPTRANWIRQLFPTERVIVIEGWNAPNRHEDLPEIRRMQEEYLGGVMKGVALTHFISSEDYGQHLSEYLGVQNLIYDKERHRRSISSTMVRADLGKYMDMLPDVVLNDARTDARIKQTSG